MSSRSELEKAHYISDMAFGLLTAFLFSVLCKAGMVQCYSDPKYTWPLSSENPLLEIQHQVADGQKGCSLTQGDQHPTLLYNGIYTTGSPNSYVDVNVDDVNQYNDYAFSIFAAADNTVGGTLFHYAQDNSAVDPALEKIKDVIVWYNSSSLVVETFGPNDEVYGSTVSPFDSASVMNTWVGFGVSCDVSKPILSLLSSTGITIEVPTLNSAKIGQPGSIRIGASFDISRLPFTGDLICMNMYDGKLQATEISEKSLEECSTINWQHITAQSSPVSVSCDGLKGYFEVKIKDSTLEVSISSLDSMATKSRVKCADLCLRTELCWSFTLNKVDRLCKLFDNDYSSNTVSSVGTHYYMRRDVCC